MSTPSNFNIIIHENHEYFAAHALIGGGLHSDRWVGPAHALVPSHPWLKPGTSVGEANYYLAQGIQYCNSVSDVSYNVLFLYVQY